MSFIGDSLSSSSGAGFKAASAPIASPTTVAQANAAYGQSQDAITQQQSLLAALQAQNGITNQSNVYNQLQGVANGTGPNPAQAMLASATGQNTANQAALMASQRGAGANTGLIARQAAQQGAANQQNAIGQGATLQANQSLNALGQLGGLATQQVGQQANATGALTGATQGEQGLLLNAIQGQNQANVANAQQQNSANSAIAQGNQKFQQGLLGGAGAALMAAGGGMVPKMADGGQPPQPSAPPTPSINGRSATPKSAAAQFLSGQYGSDSSYNSGNQTGTAIGAGVAKMFKKDPNKMGAIGMAADGGSTDQLKQLLPMALMALARGGMVPALVSPGERYLPPDEVEKVAKGKNPLKAGEKIPGKAKYKGNNYANDTVPKTLEEGGIVLPKSVMESKHPHWAAHKFVSAILAKQGLKKK